MQMRLRGVCAVDVKVEVLWRKMEVLKWTEMRFASILNAFIEICKKEDAQEDKTSERRGKS
jgi:hypothetical protein